MINYNKNKLINKTLDTYYDTFSHTLDTFDFVPEKYNAKISRYIFKNLKRTFRKIDREDRKFQREFKKKIKAKLKEQKKLNKKNNKKVCFLKRLFSKKSKADSN